MRIKSIELINLKSYKNSKIEFSEKINLLIGANNSGKSTIIKSLLNLQYRIFDKKDIRATQRYAKIYTEIIKIDTEKDNRSFYSTKNPKEYEESKEFTICWGIGKNDQPEDNFYYNPNHNIKRVEFDRVVVKNRHNQKEIELKTFPRFADSEDRNNFIYPFLAKRKSEFYDSNFNQEQTFKVSEDLRNLGAKIQKIDNSSHPKHVEFIKLCDDILGFKIGVIPAEQNNGFEPGIYVTDTELISIRSMGDGIANIVGFIVILLTENNKLFLIEELENDIHPKALKKLLDLIIDKSNNNQFVISTHSHIILKNLGIVPESKIFYIDWNPYFETDNLKESIPTSVINEVENSPEKRIEILEKLGYEFHDFELFGAYLILEESSAERIIRDFLIPNIVPELYNKIKTIAAQGVDDLEVRVIDFNRLFVFLHTSPVYLGKAWVIADGDKVGTDCIKKLKENFKSWPQEHFINFTKGNFEEYYPIRFKNKIDAILILKDNKKREAKKQLLNEVMQWALTNRDEAIEEFQSSAQEVIMVLKDISSKVSTQ
ncbi:MAG: AAA family ATPase [Bacteroidia bacterium]